MPWDDAPDLRGAELIHDQWAIDQALDRMAREITQDLGGRNPLILGVMIGGMIPAGRLLPRLDFPLEVDYVHATRYRNELSGEELVWHALPTTPIEGRDLLVVDDILDEGNTLAGIIDAFRSAGARSVRTAVLVDKRHDRKYQGLCADYVGLEVEDRYVFGAGMDCRGLGRNADGIYAIDQRIEQAAKTQQEPDTEER
ncbi:hypoxanthine-guanine phosphoribosyltransferase [Halorhodospira halophila]|uniref:Phosphoribosyltransferase n=1 Tax=Halorhodospira halophila (strain DSM 244 / SL1) TaxID=349124 RepID=A1WWH3_HALHL|nr:hypoxanthine-guanine phosphoribosyltransferase [Halorhodospira halophila]ABM62035.1 phosphoribosyltransferase [Halorhodospira halophila SL1]MBK1728424.1 hypoxanthine-guanine phosphoribosyltransferase [Halorhodospira halophila]